MPNYNSINKRIQRVDAQARRDFILKKDAAIKAITAIYGGAFEYIANFIEQSPSLFLGQNKRIESLIQVGQAMDQTQPVIESRFREEVAGLASAGSAAFTTQLLSSGIRIKQSVGDRIALVPKATSRFIMDTPAYSDQLSVSQRIWGRKKYDVASIVNTGILQGKPPNEIADEVRKYSLSGNGFNNAFRLVYGELTRTYSKARLESVRQWNTDPDARFKIIIEQYLSNTHSVFDICDVLAGFYDPDDYVPVLGRHPECNCGEREHILTPELAKKIRSLDSRLDEYRRVTQKTDIKVKVDFAEPFLGESFLRQHGYWTDESGSTVVNGVVTGSENQYNLILERITKSANNPNQQKILIQALANAIDPAKDVKKVLGTLKILFGIEPQVAAVTPAIVETY